MPRVNTSSLRQLTKNAQSSTFTGAINESADYIDELEKALIICMEAMRKNLSRANYKDEIILYDAFKLADELLNDSSEEV